MPVGSLVQRDQAFADLRRRAAQPVVGFVAGAAQLHDARLGAQLGHLGIRCRGVAHADAARDGFQRVAAHDAVEHGQRVRSGFRLAFRQDVPDLVRRLHGRLLSSRSECAHHSWRIHTERTPKTQPRSAIRASEASCSAACSFPVRGRPKAAVAGRMEPYRHP